MQIGVGQFKAQCLRLIAQVQQNRQEITISKHGKPVAKLVPVEEPAAGSVFGYLQGTVEISGDIVSALGEDWEVEQ